MFFKKTYDLKKTYVFPKNIWFLKNMFFHVPKGPLRTYVRAKLPSFIFTACAQKYKSTWFIRARAHSIDGRTWWTVYWEATCWLQLVWRCQTTRSHANKSATKILATGSSIAGQVTNTMSQPSRQLQLVSRHSILKHLK